VTLIERCAVRPAVNKEYEWILLLLLEAGRKDNPVVNLAPLTAGEPKLLIRRPIYPTGTGDVEVTERGYLSVEGHLDDLRRCRAILIGGENSIASECRAAKNAPRVGVQGFGDLTLSQREQA